jgi:hypothetical protein
VTFHHGFLFIDEPNGFQHELFNHARTAAYLQSSSALGCGSVYGVLDDGGCASYRWVPPQTLSNEVLTDSNGDILTDEDGNILIGAENQSDSGWYELSFSNPVDDLAPWYNPSFPESGEALGFWVTEWTGLDSGHIRREVTQVGAYRGGGVLGAMGSTAREMGFEVILIGESERALDYLYRWLDATLSSVCATCATDTILVRRYCAEVDPEDFDTVADGVVEMRGVGLISGLQWGAPPVERAGCFMRRVNFTMAATDPCMYGYCTDVEVSQVMDWDACFAAANLDPARVNCRPSCSEMDGLCRLAFDYTVDDPSAVAPIITLVAPTDADGSYPMRIRTYANNGELLPEELCGAPLLGELYVTSLPPYSELRYDVAARKVEFRSSNTGGWINGFGYIGPNDVGTPRFFALGCGDFTTIIEPADFCTSPAPDDTREFAEVTLETRPRMGCA